MTLFESLEVGVDHIPAPFPMLENAGDTSDSVKNEADSMPRGSVIARFDRGRSGAPRHPIPGVRL